jgi:tol-pal system protein YbgF
MLLSFPAGRPLARAALRLSLALPLLLAGVAGTPALAQSGDIASRLNRLESDIQALSREVYRGRPGGAAPGGAPAGALPPSVAGEMEVRMTRLETEIQQLTGKYEETNYQLSQIKDRFEKLQLDLELRLNRLEEKAGLSLAPAGEASAPGEGAPAEAASAAPAPLGPPPPAARPAPTAAPPPATAAEPQGGSLPTGSVQEQYDYAIGLLKRSDYAGAEKAFAAFVKANPTHALTPNAQYWLGESYYVRNKFKEAAVAFAEGFQRFPKSDKAKDFLLKLGISLGALDNKRDACVALKQLDSEFPDAPQTVKRRAEQERNRLACK